MKRTVLILILLFNFSPNMKAQDESKEIKSFFDEALSDQTAYENLRYLCKNCKGRITGSPQAAAAVEFTYQILNNMRLDSVYKQAVQVPH